MEHLTAHNSRGTGAQRIVTALLLFGPVCSAAAVSAAAGSVYLPAEYRMIAAWIALAFWSPLPMSIPALALQDVRDQYAPGAPRVRRAIGLIPHLCTAPGATGAAGRASIAGFLAGVAMVGIGVGM
jgi:hypothetical protein